MSVVNSQFVSFGFNTSTLGQTGGSVVPRIFSPSPALRPAPQLVQKPTSDLYEAALEYLAAGFPITLCRPGQKRPFSKSWPTKIWTAAEIAAEFAAQPDLNVGIVLGPRSGIIDLECDGPDGDKELLDLFDGDFPVTPLWHSARGPHRLFTWHDDLAQIGKSSITLGSLEVRLGAGDRGAQSLLPPSLSNGWERKWKVSLADCDPAPLPPGVLRKLLATFGRHSLASQSEESLRHSIAVSHAVSHHDNDQLGSAVSHAVSHHDNDQLGSAVSHHPGKHKLGRDSQPTKVAKSNLPTCVEQAIVSTLPGMAGVRNRLILQFARQLKGRPELSRLKVEELKAYVREWHKRALSAIETKDFDVTWQDFVVAWGKVKFPAGQGPLDKIYAAGLKRMPPLAQGYHVPDVRNLIALCCELQRVAGDGTFWLGCRPAGAVLGVSAATANRYLLKLQHDEVLHLITPGKRGRSAEYRYEVAKACEAA